MPAGQLEAVPGTGDAELRLPLPRPLADGAYRVSWITAGPDGHPVRGSFGFTVALPAAAPPLASLPNGDAARAAAGAPPESLPDAPGSLPVGVR